MKESTRSRTRGRGTPGLVITIAWLMLTMVLSMMCIRIFGDITAAIGVPALVVAAGLIWYFTERRDRNRLREDR